MGNRIDAGQTVLNCFWISSGIDSIGSLLCQCEHSKVCADNAKTRNINANVVAVGENHPEGECNDKDNWRYGSAGSRWGIDSGALAVGKTERNPTQ
jgi:hypothetical protein